MKLQALTALFTIVGATNAHSLRPAHAHKRQATIVSSVSSSSASASASSSASASVSVSASSSVAAATSAATSVAAASGTSVSLAAATTLADAAGTGLALSQISSGMPTQATYSVTATYAAGASAPVSGAPALPTPFIFKTGVWPAEDVVPDTTSDEVKEWMKELDGYDIPDLSVTVDGSCASDPAAVANASDRGWWTCGGYTRATDITACPDKYTWGVSFDDGPSPYTQTLLKFLSEKDLHATFFVVGSRVLERPQVLVEEYMTGHEISVHTWSHRYLTTLTNEQIVAELGWTRKIIKTVLGVTPTTMRPPYGDIDDRVRAISLAMGLVPIIWTRTPTAGQFDTNDWKVAGGIVDSTVSLASFEAILGNASLIDTGFIVLEHDLFQVTVDLAIGYTLNAALTHSPALTLKPIGECSNIPTTDLYLESTTNKTFPYPTNNTLSANGTTSNSSTTSAASGSSSGSSILRAPFLSALSLVGLAAIGAAL